MDDLKDALAILHAITGSIQQGRYNDPKLSEALDLVLISQACLICSGFIDSTLDIKHVRSIVAPIYLQDETHA